MSLQVWLPLNGDLRNQGISNIIGTNYNSTVNTAGKIGSCYYFNGSNMRIEYPHDKTIWSDKEISICMWYKWATGGNESGQCVIDIAADLCLSYKHSSSGIQFGYWRAYSNNGTRTGNGDYASTYYTDTTWHHIVLICDHNFNHIYVDGVLSQTFDKSNNYTTNWKPLLAANYNKITIGKSAGSNPYASGYVNDVRIYDHALSAAEVKEISQGLILHYKLDQSNPNLISSDTFVNTPWATAIAAHEEYEGRLAYRLQCRTLYVNTSSGTVNIFPDITYQENTQYTLSITWRDDYRTDSKNSNLRITFNYTDGSATHRIQSPANTVSSWIHTKITSNAGKTLSKITASYGNSGYLYITDLKLEVGTLDTGMLYTDGNIEDSSGYNHNGTIINSPTIVTDSPRYSSCLHISATNQHIQCGTITTTGFNNSYSFSWWGKASTFSGTMQWGFSDGVRLNGIYNGTLWNTGDSANNPLYNPGTTTQVTAPTTGVWHHFVMVGDGTSCKVYKDGIHWGTAKTYKTISGTQIYINGWANNTGYSHSDLSISDFRVYCTALDADAIRQLYEVGAKVDNKQNLHAFELVENNSKIQITKQGQVKCNELEEDEQTKFYQTDQIIETNEIIEL